MWPTTMTEMEKYQMNIGGQDANVDDSVGGAEQIPSPPEGIGRQHDEPLAVDQQEAQEMRVVVRQGNGQQGECKGPGQPCDVVRISGRRTGQGHHHAASREVKQTKHDGQTDDPDQICQIRAVLGELQQKLGSEHHPLRRRGQPVERDGGQQQDHVAHDGCGDNAQPIQADAEWAYVEFTFRRVSSVVAFITIDAIALAG